MATNYGVRGSNPFLPNIKSQFYSFLPPFFILGCRQVVRLRTLTPPLVGSNPSTPDFYFLVFFVPHFCRNKNLSFKLKVINYVQNFAKNTLFKNTHTHKNKIISLKILKVLFCKNCFKFHQINLKKIIVFKQ